MNQLRCPICGAPWWTCGEDHMVIPPVDIPPPLGGTVLITNSSGEPAKPAELKEYSYWVGDLECTAMLNEEMAKNLNAVPVGQPKPAEKPRPKATQATHNKSK